MLTVRQVLTMAPFANSRVVAGEAGLDHEVRWAHVVDIPQGSEWIRPGELLLTTFYSLQNDADAQVAFCQELADKGVSAMAVATGKYLECVPESVRAVANKTDFPIIELPWSVAFGDVVRAVSETTINDQYQTYKQSLAIHTSLTRVVLDGGSLQNVADALSALIRRPVEIDDLAFGVLAAAGGDQEIDESRRTAVRDGHSSTPLLEYLRRSGVQRRVRETLAPQRIDVDEQTRAYGMTKDRLLAPIVVARRILGYVWIIAGNRDLEPLDLHAIEHAATVAALIFFRNQTASQAEERAEMRLLSRLLAQDTPVDNTLREEAARARLRLEMPHAVIVVEPGSEDLPTVEMAARNICRRLGLPAILGERVERLTIVLECPRAEAIDEVCSRLVAESRPLDVPVHVGASPQHNSTTTLYRAYEQALETLALLPALGSGRQWACFDELGLLHWLYALPPGALAENAYASRIARLADHDRERSGELLHTLEVFLECDGNGVQAAEQLIVHRHTLKYRLARISQICDVDLSDSFCKLNLRAALLSRRLHGSAGN